MTRPKILLDPDDFDALHLSALVNGGIGHGLTFRDGLPCCVRGHTLELDGGAWRPSLPDIVWGPNTDLMTRLENAGLTSSANDDGLTDAGVPESGKVDFERYITILNIDIKESK